MSSSSDSFAHLHVHTEYSMLDGAARISNLVDEVARQEMPAVAMTDHGVMFGAYEFWKHATAAGVNPVIGVEAYLTPGTHRSDKTRVQWGNGGEDDVSGAGAYTHVTLLAETTEGMHNLFRMSSKASLEGYYFKPRMDRELLQTYSKGVIATTGCPSSEVQTYLRLGQYDKARQAAAEFRDIFGADNYFVEIMDHGLGIEKRVLPDLMKLSQDLGIPLLATNDLHYTTAADAEAHAALLCVQSGSTLDDPKRFKFDSNEFYVKTPAQMRALFADFPEAADNTLLIAQRANVTFDESANYMPIFPVAEGETEVSFFESEVRRGLEARYPGGVPDKVREQAEYEIGVISQMGFASYFLVVADFINWAKSQGIRVGPGRGSGAGSMAAFAMRITELDPLEHGLIFERFLNPDRVSMPDFDVDFDERRRNEVIRYVTEKYGDDRVAQIVTFGTIKAKQALKDAARVLGHPFGMGEKLTKLMPAGVMGKEMSLQGVVDSSHERYKEAGDFRALLESDSEALTVFERAQGLENLKRQWGVHAAGVIMSSAPLMDTIPIMKRDQDGQIVTQFDFPSSEALGLVKMDFLSLRNLTIIDDALDNIELNRGHRPVLEDLTLDDSAAYELMSRGDTLGVFQLDGGPMRSLLRLLKPDSFEDVSAVLALYRPGPMGADSHTNYALRKNGQQDITPLHPELAEALEGILGGTYGLIVYQEQVMEIAQKLAGYTLAQADLLRRAMGKKKKAELDIQFEAFREGMRNNGFSDASITALWEVLVPFSDYAFNKAHSAAYGMISYWTAYLKAHFPAEYMAALLTSVSDQKDKSAVYLNECRRMGIQVLPPDVNESIATFSAVGEDIRFGLAAIRNVGVGVVDLIRSSREEKGAFVSFHDFVKKVPSSVLNKRCVESLIKGGAFDQLGHTRRALFDIHENTVEAASKDKRAEEHGHVGFDFDSLFDEGETSPTSVVPDRPEWPRKELLSLEREMLGLYVSDHPLAGLERAIGKEAEVSIAELLLQDREDGESVTIAGLITGVTHRVARSSGNPYAQVTIEDFGGELSVMFLGKTYKNYQADLVEDTIVALRGRVSNRDDGLGLHAVELTPLSVSAADDDEPLRLTVAEHFATQEILTELDGALSRHPGQSVVHLRLVKSGFERVFELPRKVEVSLDLMGEVKSVLGAHCLSA
ncbi:DNA polymerase III subunit alpha [Pontimonas sp.]|nr:DNA polymerase III subunit alpha [Pontimonas sp.]